eukprot:1142560-Pelagomonas_calceolata.AAC.3
MRLLSLVDVPSKFAQHSPLDPTAMPGVQCPVAINTLLCPLALLHGYSCTMDSVLLHTMVSLAKLHAQASSCSLPAVT